MKRAVEVGETNDQSSATAALGGNKCNQSGPPPFAAAHGSEKIYVISKLWIASLENHSSDAVGYETVGYTPDKQEAEAMVAAAGFVEGCGWPIRKGERMPRMIMREVTRISLAGARQAIEDAKKNTAIANKEVSIER